MKALSEFVMALRPRPGEPHLGPVYPLSTERLLLRPPDLSDVDAMLSIHSREDVAKHMLWHPWTRKDAHKFARGYANPSFDSREGALFFVLLLKDGGTLIGDVNLIWERGQGEIGFALHPKYQRSGYAVEACRVLFVLAFKHLHLERIRARCDARNERSYKLMERLGMERHAYLPKSEFVKGEWWDQYVYTILARDWLESDRSL